MLALVMITALCSSTVFATMYYPGDGTNGTTPADEETQSPKYYPPQQPDPDVPSYPQQ